MVIYTREEKVLIIPEGEGCGCQGGGQPSRRCEREKREAYESGYTAGLQADCGEAIDEAYNSGYTAGLEACSGSTDCSSAITEAYQSGYTAGLADCSGSSCTLEEGELDISDFWDGGPTVVYPFTADGFSQFTVEDTNGSYAHKHYMDGYNDGLADCSGETPCDCSSAITEAYQSGYTEGFDTGYTAGYTAGYNQGQADCPQCSGGTSCNLQDDYELYLDGSETAGQMPILPSEGYDGISEGRVFYMEAYQNQWNSGHTSGFTDGYQSGYTAGLADCSGGTCPTETGLINLDSGWSGYESYQPLGSGYYDEVIITDAGYGQAKFDQGYELGLATCSASSGSCLIEDEQTASLGYDWTGFTIVYPSQGYDGLGRVLVADLGYGQAKYDDGYADGHTSGYTEGYNEAITANCGSAITEAYESGVTEGQGSIFSVKVRWFSENGGWIWEVNNHPPLFIVDESGVSHTLNYQYSQSPDMYRRNGGTETDTPTGSTYYYEYAGYLQDGAKYIQPYQVQIPMLNDNLWNNNISGLSVEINGEVIHNWQTGPYGDVYDDWQFGSGAWRFTPLATVVSDTYYDATHKMVTFYIQGQVPNNN